MSDYPVQENGEPLVSLPEAAAAASVEVVFSDSKIVLSLDRAFYLREGLIDDFIAVARDMNGRGWILKVEDGYRSPNVQKHLTLRYDIFDSVLERTIWECGGQIPSADLMLRRTTALIAAAPKIGTHISASAIDMSVLRRDDHTEVDRGGPYLEMSERTPMQSPFVSEEAFENRQSILAIFERYGFVAYPFEFWHFGKGDAYSEYLNRSGKPARYGAVYWNADDATVTPVEFPTQRFHSLTDIAKMIDLAIERRRQ